MEYGLIGEKLGHSFSKTIHEELASYSYELKELTKEELPDFLLKRKFKAINVTIPYKQAVIPYLDSLSDSAKEVGAVNTILNKDGKLIGYNTDYYGLLELIKKSGISIENKKVLILGAGGAMLAVKACCKTLKASSVTISDFKARPGVISYDEIEDDYEIIFNATPSGMYPNFMKDVLVDVKKFKKLEGVIDCVYNPLSTNLVLNARILNIKAMGGLYMLIAQAIYAIEIFLDKKMDKSIIDTYYQRLVKEKINIALIGMPSSGKTTIGRLLSERLNKEFIDIDQEIINQYHIDIADYINTNGEEAFRKLETETTFEVSKKNNCIISCGGGIILKEDNMRYLHYNSRIIFIDRPLELLTPTIDRPLSSDIDKLRKRFTERYDKYLRYSDYHIMNDSSIDEVVNKIIEVFKNENPCY